MAKSLRMPVPRLSEDEMREIVAGRLAGALMFSGEISESVRHLCILPLGMGAFSPPPELVKAILGSSEPPETIGEDPPKPPHPGYPSPPGDPPPKPVLGKVPSQLLNDLEWGEIEEEEVEAAKEAVEQENRKRIRDWEEASFQWQEDIDRHRKESVGIDGAYQKTLEEWRASLPAHEEAKRAREEAREEWVRRYNSLFDDWLADVGEFMGRMKDAFPRGLNGYPMFHRVQVIHKEDWERIQAAILRQQEHLSTIPI